MSPMYDVAIAATFELPPKRYPDYDAAGLFSAVLSGAFQTWNVSPRDIDGLLTTASNAVGGKPDLYTHQKLISMLGASPRFSETLNVGGASYSVMIDRAASAIRNGAAKLVLCIGASKFLKPSSGAGEIQANVVAEPDFEAPYGPFIPAYYGLIASQFMERTGATREDLASVAVSSRQWALLNPDARMYNREPLSISDVLKSRSIASPFNYLDCSIPSEGGGAILVAREDVAHALMESPAFVLGFGEAHDRGTMSGRRDLFSTGAVTSGKEAFRRAGLTPQDIDVIELYDAFSSTPLILLEELGFCASGTAGAFVRAGATAPGGALPMNTNGGLMSYGHTGSAGGLSLVIEAARQVSGVAKGRQVADVHAALVHCYAGIMFDHTTLILGRKP